MKPFPFDCILSIMKRLAIGILFWLTSSIHLQAQSLYYPPLTGSTWETLSTQSQGFDPSAIDSLYGFLDRNNSKGFMLLQDGKIVLEKHFGNFTQDSVWYWASAGKTLTGFLAGIAQSQGLLELDASSKTYLGNGWSSMTPTQEDSVKVWHHLTMSTGLDYTVSNLDCTDPTCLQFKAAPGTQWYYHNAPYTLMDGIIEGATGQKLNAFFSQQVAYKTGISGLFVPVGDNNVFFSKMRSMARFGLLMLGDGQWNGQNIIGDTSYLRSMTQPSQILNPSYGYLTWLNGQSAYMLPGSTLRIPGKLLPSAPSDAYAAMGKNGQIICVIPSQNRVWVRIGDAWSGTGIDLVPNVFCDRIWSYINQLGTASIQEITGATESLYPQPAEAGQMVNLPANWGNCIRLFAVDGTVLDEVHALNGRIAAPEKPGFYFCMDERGQRLPLWVR